jgi:hypothetical protein
VPGRIKQFLYYTRKYQQSRRFNTAAFGKVFHQVLSKKLSALSRQLFNRNLTIIGLFPVTGFVLSTLALSTSASTDTGGIAIPGTGE